MLLTWATLYKAMVPPGVVGPIPPALMKMLRLGVAEMQQLRLAAPEDLQRDLLVEAPAGGPVIERFTRYAEVTQVLAGGETRASVRLASGLQADLRVVPAEEIGRAHV